MSELRIDPRLRNLVSTCGVMYLNNNTTTHSSTEADVLSKFILDSIQGST